MFRNYLLMTLRQIRRHAGFTLLNIAGLAIGLCSCILILLYVQEELTYDRFHYGADRIVKVQTKMADGEVFLVSNPPPALTDALVESSPAVLGAVHFHDERERSVISRGSDRHYEDAVAFADQAFLEVFDFPMRSGDRSLALQRPNTVLITEDIAKKYFGDEDPLGQVLDLDGRLNVEVTGVLENLPSNTVFTFDFFVSLATRSTAGDEPTGWSRGGYQTFLVMRDAEAAETVRRQVAQLMDVNAPRPAFAGDDAKFEILLTRIVDLHLEQTDSFQRPALGGTLRYVYLFSAIAALILLIACLNFTNLSTARASQRAREIGLRKVVGASRSQLVRQFLGEAFAYAGIALIAALLMAEASLPWFNTLVEKRLTITYWGDGSVLPYLTILYLIVGHLAGGYPAFLLSSFRPAHILKGNSLFQTGGAGLRKALVVFQFAVSVVLIVGVIVVHGQLRFMQEEHLALQPDQVILMPAQEGIKSGYGAFKSEMNRLPGVGAVTVANFPEPIGLPVTPEGSQKTYLSTLIVDADFVKTMGIRMVDGRDFIAGSSDEDGAVILNKAAVQSYGWVSGLGRRIDRVSTQFEPVSSEVIGVTEDFYIGSLKHSVRPLMIIMTNSPDQPLSVPTVLVRLKTANVGQTLDAIEQVYASFEPAYPFEFQFLDDRFAAFYRTEQRLAWMVAGFSMLAILIGCLGLFGLATFAGEQRTKEIGIRKVLGATVPNIVTLLSRDFVILIGAAFAIGAPIAHYAMHRWLEDFAHRIEIGPFVFIQAGILILFVGLLPVAVQAFKAAATDPVKCLNPFSASGRANS